MALTMPQAQNIIYPYAHGLLKRQEVQNFVHPYANSLENASSSKYHSSLLRGLKMQRVQNIIHSYPHIHISSTCKSQP